MRRTVNIILPLICLAVIPMATKAYDDGDAQLWLKFGSSAKLGNGFSAKIEEEMKFGNNMSEFYDEETILMLYKKLTGFLTLGAGYRQVYERKNKSTVGYMKDDGTFHKIGDGDHYWRGENRPTADVVLKHKVFGWSLEDRVRSEYRMKEGSDEYWRFRNRVKIKSPWKPTALKLNPWVAWEMNYSNTAHDAKVDRHRLYAGISSKFTKHVKGGVYYLLQLDDKDSWRKYNVLGLSLGASF